MKNFYFCSNESSAERRSRLRQMLEIMPQPYPSQHPAGSSNSNRVLDFIESVYLPNILHNLYIGIKGNREKKMRQKNKRRVWQSLSKILIEQLTYSSPLVLILWTLSLMALAESKNLLQPSQKAGEEQGWELDEEAVYCSRMDAVSYAEGIRQLLENACQHSDARRAYFFLRVHETRIEGDGVVNIWEGADRRKNLNRRIQKLTGKSSLADRLNHKACHYLEFEIVNDAMTWVAKTPPCGIQQKYLENLEAYCAKKGITDWKVPNDFGLNHVFCEDFPLPDGYGQSPAHISRHYGLRIFQDTVLINGGYFYVSSPRHGEGSEKRVSSRYEAYYDAYKDKKEKEKLPDLTGRPSRLTFYFILLPIIPHWHEADSKQKSGRNSSKQEEDNLCFSPESLTGNFTQTILRLQYDTNDARLFFEEAKFLRGSASSVGTFLPLNAEEKQQEAERLCQKLSDKLCEKGSGTVCLIDLMCARYELFVELLAKALFLYASGCPRTGLFALLFPSQEAIWEMVRFFSIFCQKNEQLAPEWRERFQNIQFALCLYPDEEQTPEIVFLLAGGDINTAYHTARRFSYYSANYALEMIPQLRYLIRRNGERESSPVVKQFPFELFLKADAVPNEESGKMLVFAAYEPISEQ